MNLSKERSCDGKRPYTKAEAKAEADRRYRRTFGRYHAYNCKHCEFWHVGHRPKARKRARA